jgi:hypothetical protein
MEQLDRYDVGEEILFSVRKPDEIKWHWTVEAVLSITIVSEGSQTDAFGALFLTPADGIPAGEDKDGGTDGPIIKPGFNQCERHHFDASTGGPTPGQIVPEDPPRSELVYNMTPNDVAGDVMIQAKSIDHRWFVDVEPCPPTEEGPGQESVA